MKRLHVIFLLILFSCLAVTRAEAGDRAVNGLLIGAGSGAIIGQVAGQNTESVLLGTAVGGAVGYAIGNSMERKDLVIAHYDRPKYVNPFRSYDPWRRHYNTPSSYFRGKSFDHHRDYNYRDRGCRKTVTTKQQHGKVTRTISTTCSSPQFRDHDRFNNHGQSRWNR